MRAKTILLLIIHALTIVAVIVCFKLIPTKREASLVTSMLFLWFPIWVFYSDLKKEKLIFWGHFQFFYFFALPIFLGRILFWNADFNNIRIMNVIDAQMLHEYSQYSYWLMVLLTFMNVFKKNSA